MCCKYLNLSNGMRKTSTFTLRMLSTQAITQSTCSAESPRAPMITSLVTNTVTSATAPSGSGLPALGTTLSGLYPAQSLAVRSAAASSSAGGQWWSAAQGGQMALAVPYANFSEDRPMPRTATYVFCAPGDPSAPPGCTPLRDVNPWDYDDRAYMRGLGIAPIPPPAVTYQRDAWLLCYPESQGRPGGCFRVPDFPTDVPRSNMQCEPGSVAISGLCVGT